MVVVPRVGWLWWLYRARFWDGFVDGWVLG